MAGTEVMWQSPVLLIRLNKVQATGAGDAAEEVILEEVVNKYVAEKVDYSTALQSHHK